MIVLLSSSIHTDIVPKPAKIVPEPIPDTIPPLGPTIVALRKARGLSQEALAEKIGITKKQVSDYENARANLSHPMVIRFSLALGVSADELLGLRLIELPQDNPSLRFTRRIRELDQLPEAKKKAILKTLDDLIRANS